MKYFSMFSGIGGFELGIENSWLARERQCDSGTQGRQETLNSKRVGDTQANRDSNNTPDGSQATCVGYSEIDKYADQIYQKHFGGRNYGDATKINARELPDFELLVGGFPCQAFSVAGKRAGFNDTRGTLFFDIARILKEKQPRYLVLENVKGLLSHDQGRTFQTIIGVLADLGYFVEWQVLNSKDFGVPQNRERVFIVGHLGGEPRRKVFPIRQGNRGNTKAPEDKPRKWKGFRSGSVSSTISTRTGSTARGQQFVRTPLRFLNRNQKNIKGDYSFTVDSSQTSGITDGARIRRLTPLECERLQGFPDNWTEGLSDTQRYKTLGNAVTVNVVEAVITNLNTNYRGK